MSEGQTNPATTDGPIGPGRMVLIVGPSGAGKDTLLSLVREQCIGQDDVVFVRRVVTRDASSAEDNQQIDATEFHAAARGGEFALCWEAHGHGYGLPRAIDDDIRRGCTVVANVSRTVIASARQTYADVVVVAITAPADLLAQRLAQRARSSDGALDRRLSRVVEDTGTAADIIIENTGDARTHAQRLLGIVRGARA